MAKNVKCDMCDSRFLTEKEDQTTCDTCSSLIENAVKIIARDNLKTKMKLWNTKN